ncbi:Uncharacterised protein [Hafnia alvei]|uniref:Nicotinate-nucleotide--dimethylbenzimidazole phosphoribosyltransferase n=1 Tax=Hafnia alvei TaxID=569 RepID=A0A377PGF2_HAFAL|nr:Uncharacterised protein [Hafnia alvei]
MQTLEQIIAQIKPLNQDAMRKAQIKLDGLLKPTGSLGRPGAVSRAASRYFR